MEELLAKHKKELKSFEGEKRTALKKIKGTSGKGKKGKEALAKAEAEWDQKHRETLQRHTQEISALSSSSNSSSTEPPPPTSSSSPTPPPPPPPEPNPNTTASRKAKKERKRQAQRDALRAAEAAIQAETQAAGPSPREIELNRMTELYLQPAGLVVEEVTADGNCLYRAVASQLTKGDKKKKKGVEEGVVMMGYSGVRNVCADALWEGREEFEPFADLGEDGLLTYEGYVDRVRDSNEWGGHLELRALAVALKRTIVVYSADGAPLRIEGGDDGSNGEENEEIRLSYHRSYYALGEHYNSVVKVEGK